jgi:hypothetical protein
MLEQPEHKDILGRRVGVGSFVAFTQNNRLFIGRVVKLNRQMLRVERIKHNKWMADYTNKYPYDCVVIPDKDVDFYLLRNADK